jgi:hypothetical protein
MDLFSARGGQAMAEDNTHNVLFSDNVFYSLIFSANQYIVILTAVTEWSDDSHVQKKLKLSLQSF